MFGVLGGEVYIVYVSPWEGILVTVDFVVVLVLLMVTKNLLRPSILFLKTAHIQ